MRSSTGTTAREHEWLLAEKYGGVETPEFLEDIKRLAVGEPLAYLIGHIPFLDATIFLDSRPFIPRPETECWVTRAIEEMRAYTSKKRGESLSVLDLCAGSGCIGVSVLKAVPDARIDFAEINARHHGTILKNLLANDIDPARARIFSGDLFAEIAKVETRYDFILANPPYIDPNRINRVQKSVIAHEPSQALFGGADGMEYISRILKEAPRYLAQSNVLYIEHEPEHTARIHTLAQSLYASRETYADQWQINRYTRLARAK